MTSPTKTSLSNTFYAMANPASSSRKGIVELINIYDYRYYAIALDGVVIDGCDKHEHHMVKLMSASFQGRCSSLSGVKAEDLLFVNVNYEDYARDIVDDEYDANDFTYPDAMQLVQENGIGALAIRVISDGSAGLGASHY